MKPFEIEYIFNKWQNKMDTMIKGKTNNMTQDMVSNIKEEMLNIKKKRKRFTERYSKYI